MLFEKNTFQTFQVKLLQQEQGKTEFYLYSFLFSGKKVRVFIMGDYEYLCNIYGITGANGKLILELEIYKIQKVGVQQEQGGKLTEGYKKTMFCLSQVDIAAFFVKYATRTCKFHPRTGRKKLH